jgi:hypothetical protein
MTQSPFLLFDYERLAPLDASQARAFGFGVRTPFHGVRLNPMDRVRLGRALGYGARHAAKTLASAVDAATTPNPNPPPARPRTPSAVTPASAINTVAEAYRTVDNAKRQVRDTAKKQAMGAGRSIFAPIKAFSGVLWLQVTGTFFALFAAFMGEGVWKLRANFKAPLSTPEAHKLYFHLIVFLGFSYFTVSNFLRASRRERQARR